MTMGAFVPDEVVIFDVKLFLFRIGGHLHFANGLYTFNINGRDVHFTFGAAHFDTFVSKLLKQRLNYTEECVIWD